MGKRVHRCTGPKHQEKRSMDYFAGLDVSVKDTSVCIVDSTGKIIREVKVWRVNPTLCWRFSVRPRMRGGAGSCRTLSNCNDLLEVRVNTGALNAKENFLPTRTQTR